MTAPQPVGWADIATRHDVRELERRLCQRLDRRFDAIEHRFDAIDHRFDMLELRFDAFEHEMKACIERNARQVVQAMLLAMIWNLAVLTPLIFGAVALAT